MYSRFRIHAVTFLASVSFSYNGAGADTLDVNRLPACEIDNAGTLAKVTEEAKQVGQQERDLLMDAFASCMADNSVLSDDAAYAAFEYGCKKAMRGWFMRYARTDNWMDDSNPPLRQIEQCMRIVSSQLTIVSFNVSTYKKSQEVFRLRLLADPNTASQDDIKRAHDEATEHIEALNTLNARLSKAILASEVVP